MVLQEIAAKRGLSWSALGQKVGMDHTSFTKYGNVKYGDRYPSREKLRDLCFALETTPEETLELLLTWAGLQQYFARRIDGASNLRQSRTVPLANSPQLVEKA